MKTEGVSGLVSWPESCSAVAVGSAYVRKGREKTQAYYTALSFCLRDWKTFLPVFRTPSAPFSGTLQSAAVLLKNTALLF